MKIKTENGYEEADWKVEGDTMIISSKDCKFTPKKGDIITCHSGRNDVSYVSIFSSCDENEESFKYYASIIVGLGTNVVTNESWASYINPRMATAFERKILLVSLKKAGFEWDAEKCELVKMAWKPENEEHYFYPNLVIDGTSIEFSPTKTQNLNLVTDKKIIDKGWAFRTEDECHEFCKKLNEAINKVKL